MAIPPKAWDIYIDRVMERVSAMDVAEWLQKLGLEQYEPAFRANEIDERVLPSLTAEDLKDLGVGLVGHRRRLLGRCCCHRHFHLVFPLCSPMPC